MQSRHLGPWWLLLLRVSLPLPRLARLASWSKPLRRGKGETRLMGGYKWRQKRKPNARPRQSVALIELGTESRVMAEHLEREAPRRTAHRIRRRVDVLQRSRRNG